MQQRCGAERAPSCGPRRVRTGGNSPVQSIARTALVPQPQGSRTTACCAMVVRRDTHSAGRSTTAPSVQPVAAPPASAEWGGGGGRRALCSEGQSRPRNSPSPPRRRPPCGTAHTTLCGYNESGPAAPATRLTAPIPPPPPPRAPQPQRSSVHWGGRACGPHCTNAGRCTGACTRHAALYAGSRALPPPPPSPGQPTPGVVKQDKSSGGSVDTTKTRSGPQGVRMCNGERPIGAAKGKQHHGLVLTPPPPPVAAAVHRRRQPQCSPVHGGRPGGAGAGHEARRPQNGSGIRVYAARYQRLWHRGTYSDPHLRTPERENTPNAPEHARRWGHAKAAPGLCMAVSPQRPNLSNKRGLMDIASRGASKRCFTGKPQFAGGRLVASSWQGWI